ncbi:MAG: hypothetical protein J6A50_03265 [Clostridia bacterium]|nr:hypothetical protein [Clostridia bacterium]
MKIIKNLGVMLLALSILCTGVFFTACKKGDSADSGKNTAGTGDLNTADPNKALYSVAVKDAVGNPYTEGVIVKFMKDGAQAAMQNVNDKGVAEKLLEKGDYTVELMLTSDEELYYDKSNLSLSAEKLELEIIMAKTVSGEPESLFAYSILDETSKDHNAYSVGVGSNYVTLTAGERNYFIFTPSEAGKYEFSFTGAEGVIGYYGAPHFVQQFSSEEPVDGKFAVSIKESMISSDSASGTTRLVIGVDAGADVTGGFLSIIRIGDPDWSVDDEPWTVYPSPDGVDAYKLPADSELKEFDLTAEYTLVLNNTDGYYHLDSENGPLVLVRLSEDSKYIASFKTILDTIGVNKYFYDENGKFVKKENYSDALLAYIALADEESGVYPLNEDLKYIIQQYGDHMGWWDENRANGGNYLFVDESGAKITGINHELAWLLMCCYTPSAGPVVDNGTSAPTQTAPPTDKPVSGTTSTPTSTPTAKPTTSSKPTSTATAAPTEKPADIPAVPSNKGEPIEIGGVLEFDAEVKAGEAMCYNVYRVSGTILKISSADAYVTYNRTTYKAKNGVVEIPVTSEGMNTPVYLEIGNASKSDKTFKVTFSYPIGTYSNPYDMELKQFTVHSEEGNEQGVYYRYVASKSGVLTLELKGISPSGTDCDIMLYNLNTYKTVSLEEDNASSTKVSIEVNAGDEIQITFGVLRNNENKIPEADITAKASLA